jgi:hypothetical protein
VSYIPTLVQAGAARAFLGLITQETTALKSVRNVTFFLLPVRRAPEPTATICCLLSAGTGGSEAPVE